MQITRETVAAKIAAYLQHEVSLTALVGWAEEAMREGDFAESDYSAIRDAVARIGVTDVRAFGLSWEDCEEMLRALGYSAHVSVVAS